MPARLHIDPDPAGPPWAPGVELALPANASRHVQVLRLQPGAEICLFDGHGGEWRAEVLEMGRKTVTVRLQAHAAVERELASAVTLALGMPANERMDGLIEKATELGVAAVAPLVCERSVLRLAGERAERKTAHWQAIAVSACEQSGRNRVPRVAAPLALRDWLVALPPADRAGRLLLSLDPGALPLLHGLRQAGPEGAGAITLLSGPEGGLSPAEMRAALDAGFVPVTLGSRVLRADTAPLAALAVIAALRADA
jgi:16S rRNA (uracil1498-N3)-methyltransferase